MSRTIVMTGATGFLGSHVLHAAIKKGWVVRALTRDPDKLGDFPEVTAVRCELDGDAIDPEPLRGADAVCHLAAYIPPDQSDAAYAKRCMVVNAAGTARLLEAAATANVGTFVYASGNYYAASARPALESNPIYPSRHAPYYLTSKLAGEVIATHFGEQKGLSVCVLRIGSLYGPGMGGASMVPIFARRLLAGQSVTVRDGGRYSVDLTYVYDAVNAMLIAAGTGETGVFNVGSGTSLTSLDIARLIAKLAGADRERVRVEPSSESGAVGFTALDMKRTMEHLGLRPTSPEDGLRAYLESLRNP